MIDWFKNSDVAHKYLSYSLLMLSFLIHLLRTTSLPLLVSVYFLTNWYIIGILEPFLKRFISYLFFYPNSSSSILVHSVLRNLDSLRISTFWNLSLETLILRLDILQYFVVQREDWHLDVWILLLNLLLEKVFVWVRACVFELLLAYVKEP